MKINFWRFKLFNLGKLYSFFRIPRRSKNLSVGVVHPWTWQQQNPYQEEMKIFFQLFVRGPLNSINYSIHFILYPFFWLFGHINKEFYNHTFGLYKHLVICTFWRLVVRHNLVWRFYQPHWLLFQLHKMYFWLRSCYYLKLYLIFFNTPLFVIYRTFFFRPGILFAKFIYLLQELFYFSGRWISFKAKRILKNRKIGKLTISIRGVLWTFCFVLVLLSMVLFSNQNYIFFCSVLLLFYLLWLVKFLKPVELEELFIVCSLAFLVAFRHQINLWELIGQRHNGLNNFVIPAFLSFCCLVQVYLQWVWDRYSDPRPTVNKPVLRQEWHREIVDPEGVMEEDYEYPDGHPERGETDFLTSEIFCYDASFGKLREVRRQIYKQLGKVNFTFEQFELEQEIMRLEFLQLKYPDFFFNEPEGSIPCLWFSLPNLSTYRWGEHLGDCITNFEDLQQFSDLIRYPIDLYESEYELLNSWALENSDVFEGGTLHTDLFDWPSIAERRLRQQLEENKT